MDDIDEFKKFRKSCCDDTTKQIMQVFELMASKLRGKLAARGNRSLHHGETNNTINFEYFNYWLNGYRNNNENVNSLRDNQQSTSLEEHKMRKTHATMKEYLLMGAHNSMLVT